MGKNYYMMCNYIKIEMEINFLDEKNIEKRLVKIS